MREQLAFVLVAILLFVAVFGLPILLSHSDHHSGCPLQSAQMVLCSKSTLEHLSLWQGMFASILFVVAALIVAVFEFRIRFLSPERVRYRAYEGVSRPTLLQELFSRGIHNRKEP